MSFIADKQTLDDLNLLGRYKPHSIFSLFNKVRTPGGERVLEEMFRHPMTDPTAINARSNIFRYFQDKKLLFPFNSESLPHTEHYLSMPIPGNYLAAMASLVRKKLLGLFLRDEQYQAICTGLQATIATLGQLKTLLNQLTTDPDSPVNEQVQALQQVFADSRLQRFAGERNIAALSLLQVVKYDHLLRHTLRQSMEMVLEHIYQLDVYIAVSKVAREKDFSYAIALPADKHLMRSTALQHPALDKAVANPVFLGRDNNVLFLTGANMAGKSTFMKAVGIALYLAHMGFPVAAREMFFSVRDGLYSSINVADSLSMGYSHFYAEVLRVKKAAEEVSRGRNMMVIFDELFKGTNVKDAYDATLSVTAAFSRYRNCSFIISTHIIEVGEALKAYPNLQFSFMPTIMEGHVPRYPYTLTEGITNDRHGMMIIKNEGILELMP